MLEATASLIPRDSAAAQGVFEAQGAAAAYVHSSCGRIRAPDCLTLPRLPPRCRLPARERCPTFPNPRTRGTGALAARGVPYSYILVDTGILDDESISYRKLFEYIVHVYEYRDPHSAHAACSEFMYNGILSCIYTNTVHNVRDLSLLHAVDEPTAAVVAAYACGECKK